MPNETSQPQLPIYRQQQAATGGMMIMDTFGTHATIESGTETVIVKEKTAQQIEVVNRIAVLASMIQTLVVVQPLGGSQIHQAQSPIQLTQTQETKI